MASTSSLVVVTTSASQQLYIAASGSTIINSGTTNVFLSITPTFHSSSTYELVPRAAIPYKTGPVWAKSSTPGQVTIQEGSFNYSPSNIIEVKAVYTPALTKGTLLTPGSPSDIILAAPGPTKAYIVYGCSMAWSVLPTPSTSAMAIRGTFTGSTTFATTNGIYVPTVAWSFTPIIIPAAGIQIATNHLVQVSATRISSTNNFNVLVAIQYRIVTV